MPSYETENENIPLKLMSYPTEMTTQQISKYRQLIWKEVYQRDYKEYYMPSYETENENIPLKLMSYPTEMTTQQISKYRQLIWKEVYQRDYKTIL